MAKNMRQQITDLTGVNDQGGINALVAIMRGERPACEIAQMGPAQFRTLVHRSVGIWADRGWPRAEA